jgi:hypothetical protein
VTGNEWKFGIWQFPVDDVEIGSADGAGVDAKQEFGGAEGWA